MRNLDTRVGKLESIKVPKQGPRTIWICDASLKGGLDAESNHFEFAYESFQLMRLAGESRQAFAGRARELVGDNRIIILRCCAGSKRELLDNNA